MRHIFTLSFFTLVFFILTGSFGLSAYGDDMDEQPLAESFDPPSSPELIEPPPMPESIDSGSTDYNEGPGFSPSGASFGASAPSGLGGNSNGSATKNKLKKTNINPKAIINEETLRTQYVAANMMIIKSTCDDLVPDLKTFVEYTRISAEHMALLAHKSTKNNVAYSQRVLKAATNLLAVVLISEDIDEIFALEELNEVDLMLKNQICQRLSTSNQDGLFFKDSVSTTFLISQADHMYKFALKLKQEAIRQSELKLLKEEISTDDKKVLEKIWAQAEALSIAEKTYELHKSREAHKSHKANKPAKTSKPKKVSSTETTKKSLSAKPR